MKAVDWIVTLSAIGATGWLIYELHKLKQAAGAFGKL
jgi:hypothetical protein